MFGSGQHPMNSGTRFSLDKTSFLLVDDNNHALSILSQVVQGFGAKALLRCSTAEAAKEILLSQTVDVLLTDGQMPNIDGYELIRWLRREASETNKFIPAVVVTGHTRHSQVLKARDCGAHFTIAKPITPKIVLERLFWIARDQRMFVDCGDYIGPDRRFKTEGPPAGMTGRRTDDPKDDPVEPVTDMAQPAGDPVAKSNEVLP